MKRTLIMLVVALIATSLSGQNRWNFTGGITFSSFGADYMEEFGFQNFRDDYINNGGTTSSPATNSFKVGGYLAITHERMVSEKGFVKTGLKYLSVGDAYFFSTKDIQYTNGYGSKTDGRWKGRPRLDYFAIPLNYGTRVSERVSIYGGVTPHINTASIVRFNDFEGPDDDLEEVWDKLDTPWDAKTMILFANGGLSFFGVDGKSVIEIQISRSLGGVYDTNLPGLNQASIWNVEIGMGLTLFKQSKKSNGDE